MQVSDTRVKIHTEPGGERSPTRGAKRPSRGGARLLDARVLESLLLNIDASLRVHSRPQLFGWVQGLLQNLLSCSCAPCARSARSPTRSTASRAGGSTRSWIRLGKSNFEIGTILGISPLTVKNHVQKILRKLNVRNRTQAVGRTLALRFLDP